jgi:tetratricopeptide (TPR) repeat protein
MRCSLFLLLTACVASEATALSPTELYARASQNVLLLEGRDAADAVRLQASAIALGDGIAATQCDLLDAAPKWRVTQATRSYEAYPHERDAARNLCRLDVPGLRAPQPVGIAREQVQVGQRVYAIGNALGLGLSLSEGLVSGIRSFGGEAWIQTTAALASGSEGGALFDDAGHLVGVTDYGRRDGQNVNFAAPAAWLSEIPARHGLPGQNIQTLAEANRLTTATDWKGLETLATDWTRRAPEHADAWLVLGNAHEALKAFPEAAAAFDKALAIMPDSVLAALGLARNQLRQQQTEAAAATVMRALSSHRIEAELWFLQGIIEMARAQADAAEAALREAVRLDSRLSGAWQRRYELAISRGDYRSAQQFASHLTEIEPAHADTWLRLANAQLQLRHLVQAMKALERATGIDPKLAEIEIIRGHVLAVQGRNAEAITAYRRALAGALPKPEFAWAGLSNVYYTLKMFPDAIAAQREAVRLAPDTLSYQADLGIALKDGGLDQEALTLFMAMRDKLPQDPFPWRQIGFVNAKLGKFEMSIAALEQSLKLAPDQAKVWHALADVYATADRTDDVRRIYQRLRGLDAGHAEQLYRNRLLPFEALPTDSGSKP